MTTDTLTMRATDLAELVAERDMLRAQVTELQEQATRLVEERRAASPFEGVRKTARLVHALARAKGWHEQPVPISVAVANLHGEVSELWEAFRRGTLRQSCDKADGMRKRLSCLEEELADIVIRAFDTAEAEGIDIAEAVEVKHEFNATRPYRHGGKAA